MAMDVAEAWRHCFQNWPPEIGRRGVLVSAFGEQIAFEEFAASDNMLLLERRAPDAVGARVILMAYDMVQALKIVDVVKLKSFQPLGFAIPAPRK
jgi:hypothetical protein